MAKTARLLPVLGYGVSGMTLPTTRPSQTTLLFASAYSRRKLANIPRSLNNVLFLDTYDSCALLETAYVFRICSGRTVWIEHISSNTHHRLMS